MTILFLSKIRLIFTKIKSVMADFSSTFSFENAIVSQFIFYATIVLLKMMLMSVWTSKNRISKEVGIKCYRCKKSTLLFNMLISFTLIHFES